MTTVRKHSSTAKAKLPAKTITARKAPAKKRAPAKKQPKRGFSWKIGLAGILLVLFSPFYYKYVLSGFGAAWHWVIDLGEDPDYRHYRELNIYVSEKYSIHGIDVSYAQGKIDWPKVKAMNDDGVHISFVFIKATEGTHLIDTYFQRNWREAAKAGLICGAYHFFRPEQNGKEQAKLFLKTVKPETSDLPLVIDVETLDKATPAQLHQTLNDFIAYIRLKTSITPIIYSGLSFYQDNLKGYYDNYTIWIAHYYKREADINKAANWSFWQHSDKARVNGINHDVDFDTFKGDSIAFNKLLIR
ncbi:glycoside hydrolase family 25 protein [Mucilaginibacter corticis]|uniref:Glycoside hydrolase family 25 protein n=1 Tax=Mucilaginibacter corticis TaxID=2597670 RepID=A0A556MTW8_9SPHI|nr:GH25 family lysozyme [Mucilaginibacter corticis]TSJ43394.1 glycoside hydrolase family 25 protein [Mucilaginibacter corticis]